MTRSQLHKHHPTLSKIITEAATLDGTSFEAIVKTVSAILPPGTGIKAGELEITSTTPKRMWTVRHRDGTVSNGTDEELVAMIRDAGGAENIAGIVSDEPKWEFDIITDLP